MKVRETKIITHIPHSSSRIPFYDGYLVGKEVLDREIMKLTDWYTDDLFDAENIIPIKAEFSRIFCDTERFSEDSQEIMSKFGMGVLYSNADDGTEIRKVTPELREHILQNFYWPHHKKLYDAITSELHKNGKALILDCHSFPKKPLIRSIHKAENRPDFNIGTDPYHTPEYLVKLSKIFFENKGYSVGIDWPYSGTIVPLEYYQKNKKISSIMLEVNRALYIHEPGNTKINNYLQTKQIVQEYIQLLQQNF